MADSSGPEIRSSVPNSLNVQILATLNAWTQHDLKQAIGGYPPRFTTLPAMPPATRAEGAIQGTVIT